MIEKEEHARATLRVFAIAAIALLGLAFSATPVAERLDGALLDVQWSLLRKFDPRPAPEDIIVVGLDESTLRGLGDPMAPWHEPLAKALARIAAAKPRAIALDLALPERSLESVRPGLDRMLLTGLAAARQNGPFVAVIDIDRRTRAARQIHLPYLAVLNDERLSLGIVARDADGVTRRFSLMVPTEDGGFPTLAGRLCRALSKSCSDGLINYALGPLYRLVPLHQVVENEDPQFLDRHFRDRIVMIGATQRDFDRVDVPVNLAGWEDGGSTSPGVVVHAQALRTALLSAAPVKVARPFTLVLVTLAALLWLMSRARLAFVTGTLAAIGAMAAAIFLLRRGHYLPLSAALFSLALAWISSAALAAWQRRRTHQRLRATFAGRVSPPVLARILRGKIHAGEKPERLELAFVAAGLRAPLAVSAGSSPPVEMLVLLGRLHEIMATAVHHHCGMLDTLTADSVVAVFGAPHRDETPCRSAAAAVKEMMLGLSRLNGERAQEGKTAVEMVVAATFGEVWTGKVAARAHLGYAVIGAAADEAIRLRDDARRHGQPFAASVAFRDRAGDGLSDFQHSACD